MAADGTKTMVAKLTISPFKEMKKDAQAWIEADPDLKKIFAKDIAYEEKVDLNPKKWNAGKLSKALEGLVRRELQILAQRAADTKKKTEKGKPAKDNKATVAAMQKAMKYAQSDINEKCSTALEELVSGKGEAKAGIALGKKAMAKVSTLNANGVISQPVEATIPLLEAFIGHSSKGNDDKAQEVQKKSVKIIEKLQADLSSTAKDAQNIAKFLLATGKKMKDSENGHLAEFGKAIMAKDVQTSLDLLDAAVDSLEGLLDSLGKECKKVTLTEGDAKIYLSDFKGMKSYQKVANTAIADMKKLEKKFKLVEKDLK